LDQRESRSGALVKVNSPAVSLSSHKNVELLLIGVLARKKQFKAQERIELNIRVYERRDPLLP